MITTAHAVASLRPNAEWSMVESDVENIVWYTEGVEPLTQAEVTAEIARLQTAAIAAAQERADAEAERVAARESAAAKLSALGLNEVEINAMMGGV